MNCMCIRKTMPVHIVYLYTKYTVCRPFCYTCTTPSTNAGMVMIIAQFRDIDQFRWTAWFQVAAGGIVLLLCTLFRDSHQMCSKRCCGSKKKNFPTDTEITSSTRTEEYQTDRLQKPTSPMVIFVSSFHSHCT